MPPTIDARTLVAVMGRFGVALRAHRDELNSLNVFPVPDGDTGTNLLLTQEAVLKRIASPGGGGFAETGDAIARASLMGARGNSGVILSQVLRGLTGVLCAEASPTARTLAAAIGHAAEEARRAVAQPKPGTVLDVLDAAADASEWAAADGGSVLDVARAAVDAGAVALEATREANPELRRAGVVDAGGKGVLLLLDALASVLGATGPSVEVGPLGPVGEHGMVLDAPSLEFDLEVMYLLHADDHAIASLRSALGAVGDSVVVVGGEGLHSVHVHTNDAEAALSAGRQAGRVEGERVESLAEQVDERCMASQARAIRPEGSMNGLVAVAEGEGFIELFRSLGAVVVPGGASANPSVRDLVAAVESTGASRVALLPNHPNAVPAAVAAAAVAKAEVLVVRTPSMPQGIVAATAFNPVRPMDEVQAAMLAARHECFAGALARAARDAQTQAGPVVPGDWLGTRDGDVVAAGPDLLTVAVQLAAALSHGTEFLEILTIFTGHDAPEDQTERLRLALAATFPHLGVEVHAGGQPAPPYLIGLE